MLGPMIEGSRIRLVGGRCSDARADQLPREDEREVEVSACTARC